MEKLTYRYILLTFILFLTSLLVLFLSYNTFYKADAAVKSINKIPLQIGDWKGRDIPLDKRVYDILETKAIINRSYISNGKLVFLSLVYYPETKVDFHAPEGCLAGRGVQISKSPQSILIYYNGKSIKIALNQLVRRHNGVDELYFYFYKAGSFVGKSYIKLRFNLALNKFKSKSRSGSLIRVSTPVVDSNYQAASKVLCSFIQALYPYLIKYL